MQLTESLDIQILDLLCEVEWADFILICKLWAIGKHVTFMFTCSSVFSSQNHLALLHAEKKQWVHFKAFENTFSLAICFQNNVNLPLALKAEKVLSWAVYSRKKIFEEVPFSLLGYLNPFWLECVITNVVYYQEP